MGKTIMQDSSGKYREPVSGMLVSDRGANRGENENRYRESEDAKLRQILASAKTISEAKALVNQYLNSNHGWGPSRAAIRKGVASRVLSEVTATLKANPKKSGSSITTSAKNSSSDKMRKMGFKI